VAVDPRAYKQAFGNQPAGVAIITAQTPNGPAGLTASSVASVSLDPPALVFSVTSSRGSASKILAADRFVVNFLNASQVQIARDFAVPGAPRFTPEQGWEQLPTGDWVLPQAHAALLCTHHARVAVGDSTVVVATIEDIIVDTPGQPLVYVNRVFHGLNDDTPLPDIRDS